MRQGLVEIVLLLDRSGSMQGLESDTIERVKEMIEIQKSKYGWEFLFLGANIDAIATAGQFGIKPEFATNYVADERGTQLNYQAMNMAVTCAREARPMKGWKDQVEADFLKRKVKKNRE